MANDTTQDFGYDASLIFKHCKGVNTLDSIRPLVRLLNEDGFHPSPAMGGEQLYIAPDIDKLIDDRFTDWQAQNQVFGGFLREVSFPILLDAFPDDKINSSFSWSVYTRNRIFVMVRGHATVYEAEQKKYQEPFAQKLLQLALKMYPHVKPVYGYLGDSYIDPHPWQDGHVAKRKIVTLSWVNFFGPEFAEAYGQKVLLNIPGWRTQVLEDGGVFYQSRPSIVVEDKETHKWWRQEVKDYFLAHGTKIRFDFA